MSPPHGAVVWSAVCDCDISSSNSFTFYGLFLRRDVVLYFIKGGSRFLVLIGERKGLMD